MIAVLIVDWFSFYVATLQRGHGLFNCPQCAKNDTSVPIAIAGA